MSKVFAVTFISLGSDYIFELRSEKAKIQPGKISAIGGHVESGEKPLDALRRELLEETTIKPVKINSMKFDLLGKLISDKSHIAHFYITEIESKFDTLVKDTSLVYIPKDKLKSINDEFTYFTGRAIKEFSNKF